MKAAEKRIFRLKSTGDVFRPEADCPENLVPACAPCNLLKTTYSLEMFRTQVSLQVERGAQKQREFQDRRTVRADSGGGQTSRVLV